MSEQHEPEQTKEPSSPEVVKPKLEAKPKPEQAAELVLPELLEAKDTQEQLLPQESKTEEAKESVLLDQAEKPEQPEQPEQEWIPGDQLELTRIPPPTIWPATLALGTTGIAFGVVTHWILSVAGLFLFLLGAAGWIEDLRKDVL